MKSKLKKNKDVIFFSLLKYVEIIITTLTIFFVAKKIGPSEMGKSIPILLYITYASYLSFGLNQVVLKNYSRIKKEANVLEFITINFQYLVIVGILNFGIAYLFLDKNTFFFTALVSSGILIRGFYTSYFRAINKIRVLNKNNIIISSILLLFVFTTVNTWHDYITFWSVSIWFGIILYFLDGFTFFLRVFKNILTIPKKEQLIYNFKQGLGLALTGLVTTILLTSDRLIISKTEIPLAIKGSYQLADNISMGFYMLVTTIFFYYYPKWIESVRNNNNFRKKIIKGVKKGLILTPIILILIYFFSVLISTYFFYEYQQLKLYILVTSLLKILVLLIGVTSIIYIGLDQEKKYLKSMLSVIIIYLAFIIIFVFVYKPITYMIPLFFSFILLIELIRKIKFINSNLID